MNDNDFLKWRNLNWLSLSQPNPGNPQQAPPVRVSTDRCSFRPSFEDRLTLEDKLFLESVGISV